MTQLSTSHDMDTLFEHIYNKLITPNFGENLGGELPLYIQPFPTWQQSAIPQQVERLMKRLEKKGISSLNINLYDLCTQILQEEGILDAILEGERDIDKDTMVSTLDSVLDIKTVIIPASKVSLQKRNRSLSSFMPSEESIPSSARMESSTTSMN